MTSGTYMQLAIDCACKGIVNGGGPFGAVIVDKNNDVVGEGCNQVVNSRDPTAHAEIVCIRNACKTIGSHSLQGCTIYTTCEPCSMCLSAIYWARIDRIVYGNTRDDAKQIGFDDSYIYEEVSKDVCQRSIPTFQMGRKETIITFQQWQQKQDKIPY
jgi:guanine deaminase